MSELPVVLMSDKEKAERFEEALRWIVDYPRTVDSAVRERARIAIEGEDVPAARKVIRWPLEGHMLDAQQLFVYEDEVPQLEADSMLFGSVFTRMTKEGVCERIDPRLVSGEYRL